MDHPYCNYLYRAMRIRNIITAFNLILYTLNIYWFYLMASGLIRRLKAGNSSKSMLKLD